MNKYLIRIILEYIEYELPFTEELLNKASFILADTLNYWNYDNHYINIKFNSIVNNRYKIIHNLNYWRVTILN